MESRGRFAWGISLIPRSGSTLGKLYWAVRHLRAELPLTGTLFWISADVYDLAGSSGSASKAKTPSALRGDSGEGCKSRVCSFFQCDGVWLSGLGWVCFQSSRKGPPVSVTSCPWGHHLPLQKPRALADRDPRHTSLPELKGIFNSKIILDFPPPTHLFPHCFFLISPQ